VPNTGRISYIYQLDFVTYVELAAREELVATGVG
jgi:hypothetical protein